MNKNINDLSKYLIHKKNVDSPLLLQKILFLIRVEELRKNNDFKVFKDEKFEVWINGPAMREVYNNFKLFFFGKDEKDEYINNKNEYFEYDDYIEKYMNLYREKGIWYLVELTHQNKGWISAREGFEPDQICQNEIDENLMKLT